MQIRTSKVTFGAQSFRMYEKAMKTRFFKILFKIKGHLYMHAKICYMSVKSLNHTFLHGTFDPHPPL